MRYPVLVTDHRRFEPDYDGVVSICDIDGTYLATDLTSLRKALAIPFQFAVDKTNIPGAVALLRELRHGPSLRSAHTPLYFVTASPPQLRAVLERKMILDGVEFDGIAFKDQLRLAMRGRLNELKHQVGYKLTALIEYRKRLPLRTRWLLFGDDLESDSQIYTLFAELCAGLRGSALRDRIIENGADDDVAQATADLASDLPVTDPVIGIYIHRTRGRALDAFPPRVIATLNHLTAALHLRSRRLVGPDAVGRVAQELIAHGKGDVLAATLADARDRLGVPLQVLDEVQRGLSEAEA